MSRLKPLYLATISAILAMGISSGSAIAQQTGSNPQFSGKAFSNYDGSFIKVGRRGRRNTALTIGAIVLGTMLYKKHRQRNRNYRGNYGNYNAEAHVDWCYNRYRSYRAYDNTFQPYNGPRRECYSPYY